ncbi:MAG TPA: hypothetical protein VMM60_17060 [Ilumatobacter sp.]|nr:hypothetical protein [Ilumatobacter sp.]
MARRSSSSDTQKSTTRQTAPPPEATLAAEATRATETTRATDTTRATETTLATEATLVTDPSLTSPPDPRLDETLIPPDLRMPVDESLRNAMPTSGEDLPAERFGDVADLGGAQIADRTEHLDGFDTDPHSIDSMFDDIQGGTSFGGTVDGRTHDFGVVVGNNDAPLLDIEGSTRSGQGATDEYGNELVDGIGPFQYYGPDGQVTKEGSELGFTNAFTMFDKFGNATPEMIGNFAHIDGALDASNYGIVVEKAAPRTQTEEEKQAEDDYVIIIEDEDAPVIATDGTTADETTGGSPTEDYAEGTSPTPRTPGSTPTDAINKSIQIGLDNTAPGSGTTTPDPMGETYAAVDGPVTGDHPSVVDPGDDHYGSSTVDRDAAQEILDADRLPDEEFYDD